MKFQNSIINFKFAKGNNSENAKGSNSKKYVFFFNFHQLIYSLFSISCRSLKLVAVLFFRYQVFYIQICKGQ